MGLPSQMDFFMNLHAGQMGKLLLAVHAREKFLQRRVLFRLNELAAQVFIFIVCIFVVSHLVQLQSLLCEVFVADLTLLCPLLNNRTAFGFNQDFLPLLLLGRHHLLLITRSHLIRIVRIQVAVLGGACEGHLILAETDVVLSARPSFDSEYFMEPLRVEGESLLGEILVADVTPDQLGPRVDPLVLNQLPGLDEHQPARVALVLVTVQLHVGLHDVLAEKPFVADGAGEHC